MTDLLNDEDVANLNATARDECLATSCQLLIQLRIDLFVSPVASNII